MWRLPKIKQPKQRRFGFNNFSAGYVSEPPATALPKNAVSDILNMRYISAAIFDYNVGQMIAGAIVAPRPGCSKITNTALPDSRECVAAYYFPYSGGNGPCYVLAGYNSGETNPYRLYYLDGSDNPQLIDNLDGSPTFTTFNSNLIVSDGGVTKYWDGTNFGQLVNYPFADYSNESIGSGNGTTVSFSGTLTASACTAKTLLLTYTIGGDTFNAADDGAGIITGPSVSGTITYTTGAWAITFTEAPDNTTTVYASYGVRGTASTGPKSTICLKRQDRLWLIGDSDNPSRLWWSGSIILADAINIWNSNGAFSTGGSSATLGGGYQDIAKDDGTDLISATMFFDRLFLFKEETYYSVRFNADGLIDTTYGVEPRLWNIGCNSARSAVATQDTMLVLAKEGLMDIKAVEASFGDLLTSNVSKDRVNNIILKELSSAAYAEPYPYDNQYWLQLDGLDYILVYDNKLKIWTRYSFVFDWAGFNWCPENGEMLIGGDNGHLYKMASTAFKDDATRPTVYVQTAFSDLGFPLFNKDLIQWSILGETDFGCKFNLKFYINRSYTEVLDTDFTLAMSDSIALDDLGDVLINDLDELILNNIPGTMEHLKYYHNLFFKELMIKITIENHASPQTYLRGIEFLGELLPD